MKREKYCLGIIIAMVGLFCILCGKKEVKAATAADVVNVAKGEVGVTGVPNKYTKDLGSINGSYSYAWCHAFVSWCAKQAGAGDIIPRTASCYNGVTWFQNHNRFHLRSSGYIPSAGDIIYFGSGGGSHVGIVTSVSSTNVYTIEGNARNTVKINGGYSNGYLLSNTYIYGYGSPAYDGPDPSPWVSFSNDTLPGSISIGTQYPLSGTISASANILNICIQVYKATDKTKVIGEVYVEPYTRSYDISNLTSGFFKVDEPGLYYVSGTAATADITGTRTTILNYYFVGLANDRTVEDGIYSIRPKGDNSLAIDIDGHQNGSGAKVLTADYDGTDYQKFYFKYVGNGYYKIINCKTKLVLDVEGARTDVGTAIQQCIDSDNSAQRWQVIPIDGHYYLVPEVANYRAMDVSYAGDTLKAGKKIQIWNLNATDPQFFDLVSEEYDNREGSIITFDTEGGSFPQALCEKKVTGVNTKRGTGAVVWYNVSGTTPDTNTWGAEAAISDSGVITKVRGYQQEGNLTVPEGGAVLSVHITGNSDIADALQVGRSVAFDSANKKVYVYDAEAYDGYLSRSKRILPGKEYGNLPVPSREGYIFAGWHTGSTEGNKVNWYSEADTSELHAEWIKKDQVKFASKMVYNGHQYELYDYPLSWKEAKQFCEEKGGYLVSISSEEENAKIKELMLNGTAGWYWLGCTDEEQEGAWKWVNGETFSYANWDTDYVETSGGTAENYGTIINIDNPPNKQNGDWNDSGERPINSGYYGVGNSGFICEYDQKNIEECTVTVKETECIYDGKEKKPTVTIKDGNKTLTNNQDYVVTYEKNINAGNAKIIITGKEAYSGTVEKSFTIAKAESEVSFLNSKMEKVYGDADFKNPVTAVTDGNITFVSTDISIASVQSDGTVEIHNAGTTEIKAIVTNGKNYKDSTAVFTLIVNKKVYDMSGVTFNSKTVTYDGQEHEITVEGELPDGVRVTYENNKQSKEGTYTVTAKFNGDNKNYEAIPDKTAVLRIQKATTGLYFPNTSVDKVYGDKDFINQIVNTENRTLTYSSDNTDVATVDSSTGKIRIKGVGTAVITVLAEATEEYQMDSTSFTLNVKKAVYDMSNVIFADKKVTYDGASHSIEVEGDLPEGVKVRYTGNSKTDAGTYEVKAIFTGDSNHEKIKDMSAELIINKKVIQTEFTNLVLEKRYGDADFQNPLKQECKEVEVKYSSSDTSVVSVDATGMVSIQGIGTATINAYAEKNNNYSFKEISYEVDVDKGIYDMTNISFGSEEVVYDHSAHSIKVEGDLPEGVSVSYRGNNKVNAGNYTVKAVFSGDFEHYETIRNLTATLTIKKATYNLTDIRFDDASVYYDGGEHSLKIEGKLPAGVSVTYQGNNKVLPGKYEVTAEFTGDEENYTKISSKRATLLIEKAMPEISFKEKNVEKTVGDKNFTNPIISNSSDNSVEYTSDDENVATISAAGNISIIGKGTTVIRATTSESDLYQEGQAEFVLTVKESPKKDNDKKADNKDTKPDKDPQDNNGKENPSKDKKVSKITIKGISKKIACGGKIKLTATVFPSEAKEKRVVWSTSNSKVAVVNQNGIVSVKKNSAGKKAVITAKATDGSNVRAVWKITSMKGRVKKVIISGTNKVKAGKSVKLKAKVTATSRANKKVCWTSNNEKYAVVSSKGVVKTKKAAKGKKVKITAMATDGTGKKSTIVIKIK